MKNNKRKSMNPLIMSNKSRLDDEEVLNNELSWRLNFEGLKQKDENSIFAMFCMIDLSQTVAYALHQHRKTDNRLYKLGREAKAEIMNRDNEVKFEAVRQLMNYMVARLRHFPKELLKACWLGSIKQIVSAHKIEVLSCHSGSLLVINRIINGEDVFRVVRFEWTKDLFLSSIKHIHFMSQDMSLKYPSTIEIARENKVAYNTVLREAFGLGA